MQAHLVRALDVEQLFLRETAREIGHPPEQRLPGGAGLVFPSQMTERDGEMRVGPVLTIGRADRAPGPLGGILELTQEQVGQRPVCAKARGIGADDLIDGAEITGAATTIGFLSDGARVLM